MKKLVIISLSAMLSACTFVHTDTSIYITVGHARIEECAQVVHVDKQEDIKFNCKTHYSEGVSAEFAGIVKALFGWVPWPF